QLEQTRAQLAAEIDKMSAPQLQQFLSELEAKLKMLLSKDAIEARAWLAQYLQVMADGYREQFVGKVPNFLDMTSAQMEEEYLQLKSKILAQQQSQAAFRAGQTQLVQNELQNNAAAARNAAIRAAAASGGA